MPAWIASGSMHLLLLCGLIVFGSLRAEAPVAPQTYVYETQVDDDKKEANLTNEELGDDPEVPTNYNNPRIEDVSVPGPNNPTEAVGIKDAADAAPMTIAPPPGFGGSVGQGGGIDALVPGHGSLVGFAGGMNSSLMVPGSFGGRSGSTREQMLREGGGNTESEAAVARGLRWLSLHQAPDGHWSLDSFPSHGRCNCSGTGGQYKVAGAAFGLLPFLGAGQTHKSGATYSKNVDKGLAYLVAKQSADGMFSGEMYEQGLATIAICEAYALSADAKLKAPAQKAINFIAAAQSAEGGWRYGPKQPGFDTSVAGWQLMALKSGQMAGLSVPKTTLSRAGLWLDAAQDPNTGGYGYTSSGSGLTTSSVGLLSRQYLGWGRLNPGLAKGVEMLLQPSNLPGQQKNMYYYYYATQVMHHFGGKNWEKWNVPMRDWLIAQQDKGTDPKRPHQKGSWSPVGDAHGGPGGRIMITSLSLLTLEVYYRHLPLYRRDMNVEKSL
jgi:hypothetical protein